MDKVNQPKPCQSNEKIYESDDVSQNSYRLIDCALLTAKIDSSFKCTEFRNLMQQTLRELSLSEVETIVWLILLDEIGWKNYNYPIKMALLFTAFTSKFKLCSSTMDDIDRFKGKFPNIQKEYAVWQSGIPKLQEISVISINKKFNELSLPLNTDLVNYNYYVDDVLQLSLNYKRSELLNEKGPVGKPANQQISTCKLNDSYYEDLDFPRID